jgi:hypothetical protein
MIKPGDRVKLTEHGAQVWAQHYRRRAHRVDWFARRGVAMRVGKLYAYILWDGRKSIDYHAVNLIEPDK